MSKRANGEGTIFKRADGRWTASISLPAGKRKAFYGKTRQDVAGKLTAALKARGDGLPIIGERLTVGTYLSEWLEAVQPTIRPQTYRRYEQYIRLDALPVIGSVSLSRLSPDHLQRLYANRLGAGQSATSVGHLHSVLHKALSDAARWDKVARNVASLVTRPKAKRHEMRVLSAEQARAFLEAASGDRLEAIYVLALSSGMRQGEILGLKWPAIDLAGATLTVQATLQRTPDGFEFAEPKTASSRRQVALTKAAVEALRRHRARQLEERLAAPYWQDETLVFATEVGTPIEATNLIRRSFKPLLRQAGLLDMPFHCLRHSAATLMLGQNVNVKIVSSMLGHSSSGITMDLYQHCTLGMQRQAVEALDAVLGG